MFMTPSIMSTLFIPSFQRLLVSLICKMDYESFYIRDNVFFLVDLDWKVKGQNRMGKYFV